MILQGYLNRKLNSGSISIKTGAKIKEMTDINLIRISIVGPAVSLNGSPTVSPVTAALCASLPFPKHHQHWP